MLQEQLSDGGFHFRRIQLGCNRHVELTAQEKMALQLRMEHRIPKVKIQRRWQTALKHETTMLRIKANYSLNLGLLGRLTSLSTTNH
jgi:hypothetical protein